MLAIVIALESEKYSFTAKSWMILEWYSPKATLQQTRQYLHVQQISGLKESSCKTWGHFYTASAHNISKKKQEQKLFYKMENETIFIVSYKF